MLKDGSPDAKKRQVLIIRGGESFATRADYLEYIKTVPLDPYATHKNWRDWISWALTETHDVLVPLMPCKQNAEYEAWKIWFERHFQFIYDEHPVLIGHSLGATFLLKWLSENTFPKKISQLHLVAPWISDKFPPRLESPATFASDLGKFPVIADACDEVHLWHSKDDPVCPYVHTEIIKEHLPTAIVHTFEDRNHFFQPAFPELLQCIQDESAAKHPV